MTQASSKKIQTQCSLTRVYAYFNYLSSSRELLEVSYIPAIPVIKHGHEIGLYICLNGWFPQ